MIYSLFTEIASANKKMRHSAHIESGLGVHPDHFQVLFILCHQHKEGFSHELHSESEAVGEGIAFCDAVHLIHAIK